MPGANGAAQRSARLGQLVSGRWRIERLVGHGGMAAVYEATHRNQSRVALKIFAAHSHLSPEQLARIQREGYAANRVGHPAVPKIHDDGVTDDGCPYLVMELLDGLTVAKLAAGQGGRLRPDRVIELGRDVLDVLAAAHERGVFHRDIKPDNLFVTTAGELKVLDFGIARLADGLLDSSTTAEGTLLGTPAFAAPEQARGRVAAIGSRTDVYGVGATLFYLLSGRHVHVAESGGEQLALAMTTPAPPLRFVAPDVPDALAAVVDRALEFDPADRFPDAVSMRQALTVLKDNWSAISADPGLVPDGLELPRSRAGETQDGTDTLPGEPLPNASPTTPERSSVRLPIGVLFAAAALGLLWVARSGSGESGDPRERAPTSTMPSSAPKAEVHAGPAPERKEDAARSSLPYMAPGASPQPSRKETAPPRRAIAGAAPTQPAPPAPSEPAAAPVETAAVPRDPLDRRH